MNAPPQVSGQHSVPGAMISRPLPAGTKLGDYTLGPPLWPLRAADAYRATGPAGPAAIYIVHTAIASNPQLRDALLVGTRAAAAMPEHKHRVKTIAAGLTGDVLWIATEEIDGSLVRDMLLKKRSAGQAGLGARAAGNLVVGICAALADAPHGALAAESVVVNRTGRVRVIDLALATGTIAALHAGLLSAQDGIAPEVAQGGAPSSVADVYSVGVILYEALVGKPLARGGQRPSEVVQGANEQIDELVARACHRDPNKRFGRVDVLGEVVGEALNKGGAVHTQAVPKLDEAPSLDQQVSLAQSMSMPASVSGNAVVDRALATALADTNEKWLITKGKLDYGPFSLAEVVAQINKGQIGGDATIQDKDSGARSSVGLHPLLGPMAEQAKQRIDDERRAAVEVKAASKEKKKGVVLYAVIGAIVVAVGVGGYFVYDAVEGDHGMAKTDGIHEIQAGELKITMSEPKPPPKKERPKNSGGQNNGGHASNGGQNNGGQNMANGNQNLSLDMSDDGDDNSETLPMGEVYQTYSKYGAQLGGCLGGGGSAHISFIIDGKSGRVTYVTVNGGTSGGTYGCFNRVMRGIQFRSIHGTRTRAEFDLGS